MSEFSLAATLNVKATLAHFPPKHCCRDLDPAELLLPDMVRQAIRDACQDKNARVCTDAQCYL